MRKIREIVVLLLWFAVALPASGQLRSFDEVFPELSGIAKASAFSQEGFIQSIKRNDTSVFSRSKLDSAIVAPITQQNYGLMVEVIAVIQNNADITAIYNAAGTIDSLNGRIYRTASGDYFYLFEEINRIASASRLVPLPDPPFVTAAPERSTMYLRVKDLNFGYGYYRADIAVQQQSIVCHLSNFRTLYYYFVPVLPENSFAAQIYFEPITEGILIYGLTGAAIPDIAASLINIPSSLEKRMEALITWFSDGLKLSSK